MDRHISGTIWTICVIGFVSFPATYGFILDTPAAAIQKFPQYQLYGKSLVLIGGHLSENNTEIYHEIMKLAGGQGKARIGIITAASSLPLDGFHFYRDLFLKHGALEANHIPIDVNHTSNNADPGILALIRNQTGFFFGGGDQYRIVNSFLSDNGSWSPALITLHQMFDAGVVISGTSAGCTCQTSNIMITRGVSWNALTYGARDHEWVDSRTNDYNLAYDRRGGIGFLDGYILDSHFSNRGRQGRMIRLLADTRNGSKGTDKAIGVDENTALVVTHAGTGNARGTVIGPQGVTFFDLSRSVVDGDSNYFAIRDVYMTYITHGDSISLADMSVNFSMAKQPMKGHEKYTSALVSNDVFAGSGSDGHMKPPFVRIATSIFDARHTRTTYGLTHETSPRFRVNLSSAGHDAEGWVERKHSVQSDITSYQNMYVEITEN